MLITEEQSGRPDVPQQYDLNGTLTGRYNDTLVHALGP